MPLKLKIKTMQMQMQEKPSKLIDDLDIHTTIVYSLSPDTTSTVTDHTWIAAFVQGKLHHPLTLNHNPYNLPSNFDISKLNPTTLATSYHIPSSPFDKILVVPSLERLNPPPTLLALDKGQLKGRLLRSSLALEKLKYCNGDDPDCTFDDIILYKGCYICAVDIECNLYLINFENLCIGRRLASCPVATGTGRVGWRKRLVVGLNQLYLVVRTDDKLFLVYRLLIRRGRDVGEWEKVDYQFHVEPHVLFVARDYCFFVSVARKFPGMHLENSIVFSEGAFPMYGDVRNADEISVFRLRDKRLGKEGENHEFPKLDWSPPPWVFDAWSRIAAQSDSHSEREHVENESFVVSNSKDENDGGMKSDLVGQDKERKVIKYNLNSRDEEDGQIADEVTKTLPTLKGMTSVKNVNWSRPGAFTPCTKKRCKRDSGTTKFEGFEVKSNVVPTLKKIWRNHGNVVKDSNFRTPDMIVRALELLSDMVQILDGNSGHSLSDKQADYLSSGLSDLRCMNFNVNWLIPRVEMIIELHGSKHLQESLENLSQSSAQVEKQKKFLLDELAKLDETKNKLKEEREKVSMEIPFSGKVKFDEIIGSGLTSLG